MPGLAWSGALGAEDPRWLCLAGWRRPRGGGPSRALNRREAPLGIVNEQPKENQRVGARHIPVGGQQVN